MKKIGTADIDWKEFENFVKTEKEYSEKRETSYGIVTKKQEKAGTLKDVDVL